MTHRATYTHSEKLKIRTHTFSMILNRMMPFLRKIHEKSWKILKKSFVIILQRSHFSKWFFQKSKMPLKLCYYMKNQDFWWTRSRWNRHRHFIILCWTHGIFKQTSDEVSEVLVKNWKKPRFLINRRAFSPVFIPKQKFPTILITVYRKLIQNPN